MTTSVPLIYAFPEFHGVAEAVADHIVAAQNSTLYNSLHKRTASALGTAILADASQVNLADGKLAAKLAARKERRQRDTRFKIAILGGSLIKILREGLLDRPDIEWSKWDVYFADERLVPFELPDSNYGQAKREIFDHIGGDQLPNIFHIDEALVGDPDECADAYEKTLIDNFARKDLVKLPMFDLLLLGCAPDGHIASLFPHNPSLREQHAWCVPVTEAPVGPSSRITLTIPVLCHAHRVTFVVEGATKAPILKIIMERPEKGLPSSIVNEGAAGRVTWFVDDDALKELFVTKKTYKFLVANP